MSTVVIAVIPGLMLLLVLASPSHAADTASNESHVRTNEKSIALLLRQALAGSPFFRNLVERLNDSDVIVYVRHVRSLPSHVDGAMTFVGAAGGRRYVVVSLAWGRSDIRTIATLGHELQHAIEVAERPAIVDTASLGVAYAEIGQEAARMPQGRAYDTAAALLAGERVWKEMSVSKLQNVP